MIQLRPSREAFHPLPAGILIPESRRIDAGTIEDDRGERVGAGAGTAIEAGALLAGRYRFDAPSSQAGWWLGTDETLQRRIEIAVVPDSDPRKPRLLDAARAAAGLASSRFADVLDATVVAGTAIVVTEHLSGERLIDRLSDGPLSWQEAVRLVAEVAAAVAEAHDAGLTHGQLTPEHVVLGPTGPRVTGLGLAAALAGRAVGTGEGGHRAVGAREGDCRALGALLAAALTARWPALPALPPTALRPGPTDGGRPLSPRQLRAGVPAAVDALARRALGLDLRSARQRDHRSSSPHPGAHAPSEELPLSAGQLSAALAALVPDEAPRAPLRLRRAAPAALLAAVMAGGWLGGQIVGRPPEPPGLPGPGSVAGAPAPTGSVPATAATIAPAGIRDFDPYGDGSESAESARLASDGDPATAWLTARYRSRADLGGLKPGVGLLVDLGPGADVGAVALHLVGSGTTLELRAGDTRSERADSYTVVASASGAGPALTLTPSRHRARYWLLWLTRLPPDAPGFRGGVAEVTFLRSGMQGA